MGPKATAHFARQAAAARRDAAIADVRADNDRRDATAEQLPASDAAALRAFLQSLTVWQQAVVPTAAQSALPFQEKGHKRKAVPVEYDMLRLLSYVPALAGVLRANPTLFYHSLQGQIATIATDALAAMDGATEGRVLPEEFRRWVAQHSVARDSALALRDYFNVVLRPVHVPPIFTAVDLSYGGHNEAVVIVTGTMVRISAQRVVPFTVHLKCPLCGQTATAYTPPHNRAAPVKQTCEGRKCRRAPLVVADQDWMDYAECVVQQKTGDSATGRLPRSVLVSLDDDLAQRCSVGLVVEVTGLVRPRWRPVTNGAPAVPELVVHAWNIVPVVGAALARMSANVSRPAAGPSVAQQLAAARKVPLAAIVARLHGVMTPERRAFERTPESQNPHLHLPSTEVLRARLVRSLVPHMHGLFAPRLGVLLATVGGVKSRTGGATLRGTVHVLLVGDPSTGKSQLLRAAAAIAVRSTSTAGIGSTTAGLTAAATKEFGEWVLEPGALVLSDGGTCAIDELRTLAASDRTSLHEAMEQQTISVAKAGLVSTLRTECCVIAACNPPQSKRGAGGPVSTMRYSQSDIGIGGPLLSRFDLIFQLWDSTAHDAAVADHILRCADDVPVAPYAEAQLRDYASYCKARQTGEDGPPLCDDGAGLLARYYSAHRRRNTQTVIEGISITVRFLEGLIRLSQAHAALMGSAECGIPDVAMAVLLVEQTALALKLRLFDAPAPVPGAPAVDPAWPPYTNTSLDRWFGDESDAGVAAQRRILARVVEVIAQLPPPDDGPAPAAEPAHVYSDPRPPEPLVADGKRPREPESDMTRLRARLGMGSEVPSAVSQSFPPAPPPASSVTLYERQAAAYDPAAFAAPPDRPTDARRALSLASALGTQRTKSRAPPSMPPPSWTDDDLAAVPELDPELDPVRPAPHSMPSPVLIPKAAAAPRADPRGDLLALLGPASLAPTQTPRPPPAPAVPSADRCPSSDCDLDLDDDDPVAVATPAQAATSPPPPPQSNGLSLLDALAFAGRPS